MTFARQYCEIISKQFYQNTPVPAPAALVLQHGAEWTERVPANWQGTQGACYANAQFLARRRKGLRYVEGFATNVIPVEHAWCIDAEGRVVDPTWGEDRKPDYCGIAFEPDLVRRIRRITGKESYSLLFTWWAWDEIYAELVKAGLGSPPR